MKTELNSPPTAEIVCDSDGKLNWIVRARVRTNLAACFQIVDEIKRRYPQSEITCEIEITKPR